MKRKKYYSSYGSHFINWIFSSNKTWYFLNSYDRLASDEETKSFANFKVPTAWDSYPSICWNYEWGSTKVSTKGPCSLAINSNRDSASSTNLIWFARSCSPYSNIDSIYSTASEVTIPAITVFPFSPSSSSSSYLAYISASASENCIKEEIFRTI